MLTAPDLVTVLNKLSVRCGDIVRNPSCVSATNLF
jgi:hypothetical protein